MEITTKSTEETKKLAEEIAKKIKAGDVIALYGDLGAGKTTFSRFLSIALGSTSRVQSPTFVIARKYHIKSSEHPIEKINHLDLYRLKTQGELQDLDLHHFFGDPTAVTIVEWPEIAEELLPKNSIKIRFSYIDENTRNIDVENIN
jgi:tRNA threonylcarbamoyladenosine biosynthesis protein TsaE